MHGDQSVELRRKMLVSAKTPQVEYSAPVMYAWKRRPTAHLDPPPLRVWTLATATCSHAAPLHFALNMATLALLGPAVEGLTGTTEMLKLYTLGPAPPMCRGFGCVWSGRRGCVAVRRGRGTSPRAVRARGEVHR